MSDVAGVAPWDDRSRRALEALCDTFVPRLEGPTTPRPSDPAIAALMWRSAGDLGVAGVLEVVMGAALRLQDQLGVAGFVASLGAEGFAEADLARRTAWVHELWDLGGPAKQVVRLLRVLTMLVFYGLPTEADGTNPNWGAIGYPGPRSAPPSEPQGERIVTWDPPGDEAELSVDVCVVGSGAGGGVIAGALAEAGLSVAVLEMGGYFTEVDYDQRELPGYQRLWLNGGLVASTNGALNVLAGSNLGGGTTINFMVCLPPPADLRAEWA
ncbi:MAG: GMC family oxidoreductase N-terminal domain-containing protein, partial [Acidimicrobiia bacterium]